MARSLLGGTAGRAAGAAAAGAVSGLSKLATLATTAGLVTKALVTMAAAAPAVTRAFEGFAAVLLHGRREYAQISGTIAGAFARLERQELLRSVATGRKIAPGTVALANAYSELRDETREFTERRMRFGNFLGVIGSRMATSLAGTLNYMFGEKIDGILDYLEELVGIEKAGTGEAQKEFRDYFRRLRDGHHGRPLNKRPGGLD